MVPIVTDGTASMCDCAVAAAACHVLRAAMTMVTTVALISPVVVGNGSLTARLKCKSCSHICRSTRFANMSTAFPQSPHAYVTRTSGRADGHLGRRRWETRFHIRGRFE